MIALGSKVKDRVTGLIGITTARLEYMNGCIQYCIQPQEVKDGKPAQESWIDKQRVEVVEATAWAAANDEPGGPPPRTAPGAFARPPGARHP